MMDSQLVSGDPEFDSIVFVLEVTRFLMSASGASNHFPSPLAVDSPLSQPERATIAEINIKQREELKLKFGSLCLLVVILMID